jgi:SAM-dependent methyltransferase
MIQNQKSNATKINRYPEIFREIKSIIPCPKQILSFGCSTGEECITLQKYYFNDIEIIGLDINEQIIKNNQNINKYKNIKYYSKVDNINEKSDLIFANSVLCRWPETEGEYTFETFENTLKIVDSLLNENGYLCIYNSKYLFTETKLFKDKYECVETKHKETGFVTKYNNNNKINYKYPYFLFKKIK